MICALLATSVVIAQDTTSGWPTFTDVTAESGITFRHQASPTSEKYLLETMGSGVAMFDADNDGRLDLSFVNGARLEVPMAAHAIPERPSREFSNRLYLQETPGRFVDVTEAAGVAGAFYGMGVAAGDLDNDGDQDLYLTGYPRNILYRNSGNRTFTDITDPSATAGSGWSTSAAFVDANQDGRLDLVVARYLEWSFGQNP